MQNLNKQMRAFYAWQEQHSLSTVAIALYYTLLNHAGKCNSMEFSVAISTLSKHTGMSERSVFRARDLLSNHNLIHIEQTAYRDCARYTIHSLPSDDSDTKSDSMTHSRTVRHQVIQCDTVSPLTSHTDTCTSIIINNDSMYSKFNVWLSKHAQHRALYSHRPTGGGGYHSARGRVKFLGSFQNIIAALVDYTHVQN